MYFKIDTLKSGWQENEKEKLIDCLVLKRKIFYKLLVIKLF